MKDYLCYLATQNDIAPKDVDMEVSEYLGCTILDILTKEKNIVESKAFELTEILEVAFRDEIHQLQNATDDFIRNFVNEQLENMKGVN